MLHTLIGVLLLTVLTACGGEQTPDEPRMLSEANVASTSAPATRDTTTPATTDHPREIVDARFDAQGDLIGVRGIPYNPCDDGPCPDMQHGSTDGTAQFALPWPEGE
jgi:hypothetical protein